MSDAFITAQEQRIGGEEGNKLAGHRVVIKQSVKKNGRDAARRAPPWEIELKMPAVVLVLSRTRRGPKSRRSRNFSLNFRPGFRLPHFTPGKLANN